MAYDIVLEVAMKAQHIQQRNLVLQGSWKWLLTEFASYYGVSDAYTKLRYLATVVPALSSFFWSLYYHLYSVFTVSVLLHDFCVLCDLAYLKYSCLSATS